MSNNKKVASIAFAGAAATAATMMGAGPAPAAALSWHVRSGSANYIGKVTAKKVSQTKPVASFKDIPRGVTKCKKAFTSGSITKTKSSAASPTLGIVKTFASAGRVKTGTYWSSCQVGGAFFASVHLTTQMNIVAKSYKSGVTTGKFSGNKISIMLSGINGNTCKVTFTGTSIPIKYLNAPHSFSLNPANVATLSVKNVAGNCFGLFGVDDPVSPHGAVHVSTPSALKFARS